MLYSEYFGRVIKQSGMPRLHPQQFRRMMNIVLLEGELRGMQRMREYYVVTEETRHFISHKQSMLDTLTKKLKPEKLMDELLLLSGSHSHYD